VSRPNAVTVAAVQFSPVLGEVGRNLETMLGRLREAADAGARLVAFPECALTGYVFADRAEALAVAEPVPGPSVRRLAEACAELGVAAAFGMLERDGDRLFNACTLVGPGGLVGSYRKIHLPLMGVDRFAEPGDRPLGVVEVAGLRVGLHVCYDGTFPEVGRVLALQGADLLILPTNFPKGAEALAEHLMATRAVENTVYAMAVNRVGEERGARFIGRSSIHAPSGETLARAGADSEEVLYAEIDPARARQKRIVRIPGEQEIDRIADRRPEFYGKLVEPRGDGV
jgi:predicted amidohydrolase